MPHEFNGKKYAQASTHQKEWGTRLITELELQGTERVLDLGCGDGTLTAQLAALLKDGEVVGLDASQGMINAAQPKAGGNLQFRLLDINALDYDNDFDVVFSNATLHWVKDHRLLLTNVQRALRSGGKLRFNFAGDGNCSHLFTVVRQAMAQDRFKAFFTDFDWPWYMPPLEEYEALARATGLTGIRVWGENADRYFPDRDAMIRWIDQPSLVPFLAHIPEPEKESFRAYVVAGMTSVCEQDDGRCFETFRRINVAAGK